MTNNYDNMIDLLEERLTRLKYLIRKEMVSQQLTVGKSQGGAHVELCRFAPHTWRFGGCLRVLGWYTTGWQFDSSINATSIEAYDNRNKGRYRTPTELDILTSGMIFGNSNISPAAWCIGGTTRTRSPDGDIYTNFTCKSPKSEVEIGIRQNAYLILRNKDKKQITIGKRDREMPWMM